MLTYHYLHNIQSTITVTGEFYHYSKLAFFHAYIQGPAMGAQQYSFSGYQEIFRLKSHVVTIL